MTNPLADMEKPDVIFCIGTNMTECHPVAATRLKKALARGARMIVADPRRIPLAEIADLYLPIRVGSDVPLLHAMAHVLIRDGLADEDGELVHGHLRLNEGVRALLIAPAHPRGDRGLLEIEAPGRLGDRPPAHSHELQDGQAVGRSVVGTLPRGNLGEALVLQPELLLYARELFLHPFEFPSNADPRYLAVRAPGARPCHRLVGHAEDMEEGALGEVGPGSGEGDVGDRWG